MFGNGTIDPSVFAPPAVSSSPASSLFDEDEAEVDQLDEEDVDAEGETGPDVGGDVQSPEPEPEPEPLPSKRTRKPSRRYGAESTYSPSLSWEDSQADETTTATTYYCSTCFFSPIWPRRNDIKSGRRVGIDLFCLHMKFLLSRLNPSGEKAELKACAKHRIDKGLATRPETLRALWYVH